MRLTSCSMGGTDQHPSYQTSNTRVHTGTGNKGESMRNVPGSVTYPIRICSSSSKLQSEHSLVPAPGPGYEASSLVPNHVLSRVQNLHGLWTLDETLDWTVEWTLDWILDCIIMIQISTLPTKPRLPPKQECTQVQEIKESPT